MTLKNGDGIETEWVNLEAEEKYGNLVQKNKRCWNDNPKFKHMNYLLMAYYIIHTEHKLSPNGTLTGCNNDYTAN